MKFSDQLREAIENSGMSRYRIAQGADIDESALAKFFNGHRGLSMKALDRLCSFLGIEITSKASEKKGD